MKILRAILLGILLWVLIFVEISVFVIGLGLTGVLQYAIHYIFLTIFTALGASIYYRTKDKLNGFVLGIFWLLVGNVLDLIITIPMFTAKNYETLAAAYSGFYSDIYLWLGFLIVIIVAGVYGLAKK